MEFGKIANVDHVNWEIPNEDPLTRPFLNQFATKKTKFYIGAPAWGHKEWIGRLYPPKTPATDFLFHYSRNFNTIELNTTHYRIPTADVVKNWVNKVPGDFLFCPKIPQLISHAVNGLVDSSNVSEWIKAIDRFGSNLGPCFLQLPPTFSYTFKAELFQFLKLWPAGYKLAIEFRHPSWFGEGRVLAALVEYLQKRDIGLVITDVAGRRDVVHTSISASFSFLRFIGNDLHDSDFSRVRLWAQRLEGWQQQGLQNLFFIVHQPDDLKTPEMSDFVIDELNVICRAGLAPLAKPLL
ncbi:MAG: DUF72 domain-containing protein [Bdellovibrionaceae bacterium]|nr:DUF72 domain-containing protein [Pseudobdellovibrionaceae bacterium]